MSKVKENTVEIFLPEIKNRMDDHFSKNAEPKYKIGEKVFTSYNGIAFQGTIDRVRLEDKQVSKPANEKDWGYKWMYTFSDTPQRVNISSFYEDELYPSMKEMEEKVRHYTHEPDDEDEMKTGGKIDSLIGKTLFVEDSHDMFREIVDIDFIANDNIKVKTKLGRSDTATKEESYSSKELNDLMKGKKIRHGKIKLLSPSSSMATGGEIPKELNGYSVNIYKSDYESSLNVVSNKYKNIVLVTDGIHGDSSTVMSDEPHLKLQDRKGYLSVIPVGFGVDDKWKMFGGNFVWSSDSRFRDEVSERPLPLHDRIEMKTGGGISENNIEEKRNLMANLRFQGSYSELNDLQRKEVDNLINNPPDIQVGDTVVFNGFDTYGRPKRISVLITDMDKSKGKYGYFSGKDNFDIIREYSIGYLEKAFVIGRRKNKTPDSASTVKLASQILDFISHSPTGVTVKAIEGQFTQSSNREIHEAIDSLLFSKNIYSDGSRIIATNISANSGSMATGGEVPDRANQIVEKLWGSKNSIGFTTHEEQEVKNAVENEGMAAGGNIDIEKTKLKYAKQDINLLEKEGGMAITDTKHGVLWGEHKDGVFSFTVQKEKDPTVHTVFKGNKAGAIQFVKDAYTVEGEMEHGGEIASTWNNWTGDQKYYFLTENGFKGFANTPKKYNELDEDIKAKLKTFLDKHPNYKMETGGKLADKEKIKETILYLQGAIPMDTTPEHVKQDMRKKINDLENKLQQLDKKEKEAQEQAEESELKRVPDDIKFWIDIPKKYSIIIKNALYLEKKAGNIKSYSIKVIDDTNRVFLERKIDLNTIFKAYNDRREKSGDQPVIKEDVTGTVPKINNDGDFNPVKKKSVKKKIGRASIKHTI